MIDEPGAMCVGQDCNNGEVFNDDTLRLKENNLRLRFFDTTTLDSTVPNWILSANDTVNAGRSYFNIEESHILVSAGEYELSDGTSTQYDCSEEEAVSTFPSAIGTLAAGEPVIFPYLQPDTTYICGKVPIYPQYDCTLENPFVPAPRTSIPAGEPVTTPGIDPDTGNYVCVNVPDTTGTPIFQLGTAAENGVALGYNSDFVQDAVSVGKADLARQLKHVAAGLAATDLLITDTLNNYSAYADQHTQIADLTQQLAALEDQLVEIETFVNDEPPSAPVLLSPEDGATNIDPASVTFSWRPATDPEGDSLTYSLVYCDNPTFSGCTPTVIAMDDSAILFAALGGGTGIFALGLIAPGLRKKKFLFNTAAISTVVMVAACSGGNGQADISTTVSGLNSGTTYQWKVIVSDGIKTTDSAVRSFTTQ